MRRRGGRRGCERGARPLFHTSQAALLLDLYTTDRPGRPRMGCTEDMAGNDQAMAWVGAARRSWSHPWSTRPPSAARSTCGSAGVWPVLRPARRGLTRFDNAHPALRRPAGGAPSGRPTCNRGLVAPWPTGRDAGAHAHYARGLALQRARDRSRALRSTSCERRLHRRVQSRGPRPAPGLDRTRSRPHRRRGRLWIHRVVSGRGASTPALYTSSGPLETHREHGIPQEAAPSTARLFAHSRWASTTWRSPANTATPRACSRSSHPTGSQHPYRPPATPRRQR